MPRIVVAVLAAASLAAAVLVAAPPAAAFPRPVSVPGSLTSVSCGSATFCVAVGSTTDGSAEVGGPQGWQRITLPVASGVGITQVSCVSPTWCMAVGAGRHPNTAPFAAALTWNGSTWAPAPAPGGSFFPYGLSCVSDRFCLTTGTTETTGYHVWTWDGTAWSDLPVPSPAGAKALLSDVSCLSADNCVLVGSAYDRTTNNPVPVVESFHGRRLTVAPTPALPAGTGTGSFGRVSCGLARSCLATGTVVRNSLGYPLAETWDGTSWTPTPDTPAWITDVGSASSGVTCRGRTFCLAFGTADTGAPAAAVWNGSSWTASAPVAVNGAAASFHGATCPSPSSCLAVGSWSGGGRPRPNGLAESWNGTRWVVQPT